MLKRLKICKRLFLRRSVWLITALCLTTIISGAAWWFLSGRGTVSQKDDQPSYHTSAVRRGDIRLSASAAGSLVASRQVDLSFSISGTVAELYVKTGERVSAGQVLARLADTGKLEAAVASAELEALQAQQTLDALYADADVSLAQAYQDYVQAESDYADALTASQRTQYSRCSDSLTMYYAGQRDHAANRLKELRACCYASQEWVETENVYEIALANYTYCAAYSSDEKEEAQAKLTRAEANLKEAKSKYLTLKDAAGIDPDALALAEAKLKVARNNLTLARQNLEGSQLVAPMDGVVISIAANQGEAVNTSSTESSSNTLSYSSFITLADMDSLQVEVSVDESDLDKLALGNRAEVVFDSIPDTVFHGVVSQIDPQLVSSGGYMVAKALVTLDEDFARLDRPLLLGLNATVEIISQESTDTLLITSDALRDLGDGDYAVFVLGDDNRLRLRLVKPGLMDDTSVEILEGLKEGELVSTGVVETR